jgi:hypothetical protein
LTDAAAEKQIFPETIMENDRTSTARNLIKSILKAKKLLRIYPSNNMIYVKAMDEVYAFASDHLKAHGDIIFKITPSQIIVDSEPVYQSDDRADNLALFFFKEGITEMILREGLKKAELEEFINILGTDFSRSDTGEDFLMATWERNFENIKVIADDFILPETNELTPYDTAVNLNIVQGEPGGVFHIGTAAEGGGGEKHLTADEDEKLNRAYTAGPGKEEITPLSSGDLSAEERAFIMAETQKDPTEQINKLANILILILSNERSPEDAEKIAMAIEAVINYSVKDGSIVTLLLILKMLKGLDRQPGTSEVVATQIQQLLLFCISPQMLAQIGGMLDKTKGLKEEDLSEYAWNFGGDAVMPLITLLESLHTIHGRRIVNNVLIHIGKENIEAIISRLSDPVWYVVRNIVYVLRSIRDRKAQDSILKVAKHEHPMVRLEVIRAIQDFKNIGALQALKDFLDDGDSVVRLTALSVLGNIAKDNSGAVLFVRDSVMEKINNKGFVERGFKEKKAFYEALVSVNDSSVEEFMLDALKKRGIFSNRKRIETRACAAHYLGLASSRNALPALEQLTESSAPLLAEHAAVAVQRIRNEQTAS